MRRMFVVLLLALSVVGVSAVAASARGGSHPHSRSGHHFRSFRHGFHHVAPGLHHRHRFSHLREVPHPHSIIFFPRFVIPSTACDPVRMPARYFRIGHEWVWVTEHWGCR